MEEELISMRQNYEESAAVKAAFAVWHPAGELRA